MNNSLCLSAATRCKSARAAFCRFLRRAAMSCAISLRLCMLRRERIKSSLMARAKSWYFRCVNALLPVCSGIEGAKPPRFSGWKSERCPGKNLYWLRHSAKLSDTTNLIIQHASPLCQDKISYYKPRSGGHETGFCIKSKKQQYSILLLLFSRQNHCTENILIWN